MKKRILGLLAVMPLMASCHSGSLVIPTVDVESLNISLPDRPVYNQGEIRSDDEFDYIDIYENSDFHGAVNLEFHESGDQIGLARLASYLDLKRSENPGGTVVISSGDMFQGSADSNLTRGYMVNYCMNYMGFDSMTLGNHEFDWTSEWIKKNSELDYKGNKIPYLCANLVYEESGELPDFVKKSVIIERNPYKIGIIGTIGSKLDSSILASCISGFKFLDEKSVVEQEAENLRNQGCDIVIWSTHNNVELLPATITGVDAIFGGHAHLNKVSKRGEIPAVATKNYGSSVAHIELKVNKVTKEVTPGDYGVDEKPLDYPGMSENADIKNIMSQFDSSINKIKEIKLGKTKEKLESKVALKNICVEAMQLGAKKANKDLNLGIPEDKIIAAYHNISGGIRADIEAGNITYNDVYKPFPFDNEIVFYKVNGKEFKGKCCNNSFSSWAIWKNITKRTELKDNEDYYLVLTDFMALSENYVGGQFEIEESDLIRTGKVVRDEVANFIYERGTIKAADFGISKSCYKQIEKY